ncbi:right-handed parallel beta-helix repeat-containing protein [Hymenobacter rigui]|uniref:Right-handed parallel beta-helix repeat-containing protein n=1 Tax=Hymenobacter rigui TaxID=334424 RepID=A0A3R9P6W9_9BACT|nr:right-handed parallel beta-helix repeat-containing protein [Hymenobacter rigui]RSK50090.1 right-handed parallel beta-helix repeat-containing protein [Hymenobacter rigui]
MAQTRALIYSLDEYSGENVQFEKTAEWWDGSPMTDAKADGIIFRKIDGLYYKRLYNGPINALWFGLKADYDSATMGTDNTAALQALIDSIPFGQAVDIFVPKGDYYFISEVVVRNKSFRLFGEGGSSFTAAEGSTRFVFEGNSRGIHYTRVPVQGEYTTQGPFFEKLFIQSRQKIANTNYDGMYVEGRCTIKDCTFRGWSGNGLSIYAAVQEGTDASLSVVDHCRFAENTSNGMKLRGPDANQCAITYCDSVDNGGAGFFDQSFLGNQFVACHGNNNGDGHYVVIDPNARTSFIGCYGEGGSLQSYIAPEAVGAMVVGGLHANGWRGNAPGNEYRLSGGLILQGVFANNFVFTRGYPNTHVLGISSDGFSFQATNNTIQMRETGGQYPCVSLTTDYGAANPLASFVGANYPYAKLFEYQGQIKRRSLPINSFAADRALWVGNSVITAVESLTTTPDMLYRAGDELFNTAYQPHLPAGWKCTRGGRKGADNFTVNINTWGGNDSFALPSNVTVQPGDSIVLTSAQGFTVGNDATTLHEYYAYVVAVENGMVKLNVYVNSSYVPIAFSSVAPLFRATGDGVGTTAQRPDMTGTEAGFKYFATDTSTWATWTGTNWV